MYMWPVRYTGLDSYSINLGQSFQPSCWWQVPLRPNHELPSHSGLPAPVGFRRKSPLPLALVFSFGRVPQSHISKLDLSDFVIQSFIVLLTQALNRVTKLSVPWITKRLYGKSRGQVHGTSTCVFKIETAKGGDGQRNSNCNWVVQVLHIY